MSDSLTLLDCTLRDGGYYTSWDFEPSLVQSYLTAMAAAGIDYVELGLRSFAREGFAGPFAYTTEDYLNRLEIPGNLKLGVMIDAKTVLQSGSEPEDAIHQLFIHRDDSRLSLVRVAAHFDEIARCGPLVAALKARGYTVGVNLMQASGKPAAEITARLETLLADIAHPDVLYFADSLGNMDASEVERIYAAFRDCWTGPVGIHTHNNMGLAVANSMAAHELGVRWIDATVQGMGRGAGNAEMELLLTALDASGYRAEALYPLALEEFRELRNHYQWGPGLLYYYSAKHGIHPTYAQELLADDRYSTDERIAIMQHLAELSANSFNREVYSNALTRHFTSASGDWVASNWCVDRDVVMVAAGPSARSYAEDILDFARRRNALVVSINTLSVVPDSALDAVITVDHNRIRFEAAALQALNKPVFAPYSSLPEDCQEELGGLDVRDFGLAISSETLTVTETGCTLPYALSAVYGMALCLAGSPKQLWLAGFDGYGAGDSRQLEMVECIEGLRTVFDFDNRVTAITPTTYPLRQGSLYAP